MKQNLIVRASAGTGKTFSLATRFIRLMIFQRVRPERIVALTFSRAAAQEIYTKLLERLWCAAASEEGAALEKSILLQGLNGGDLERLSRENIDWTPGRFACILRDVINTQYHGSIGTLDSFILKIVRSFPLEMGFQNAVCVLDSFAEKKALSDCRNQILSGEDVTGEFTANFKAINRGRYIRALTDAFDKHLFSWRDFMLAHPESRVWTVASMCNALGIEEHPNRPDVDSLPITGKRFDPFEGIASLVKSYDGEGDPIPKTKAGKMMTYLVENPDAEDYKYTTDSGKEMVVKCGSIHAETIRKAFAYLVNVRLNRIIELVYSKLQICKLIEREYDVTTRKRGQLTFSDFTDCQALAEEDDERALNLENLQFRFDSRFDHWALDEFQDTSELQWLCLRRLVQEAAQPCAERSVMAVGDLKQSIYTWRGGNDAPFKEMMYEWPEFRGEVGEIVPNAISYRYEKNTADFINAVFGKENIKDSKILPEEFSTAVGLWLNDDCWMEHKADKKEGVEKCGDYVQVVKVRPPENKDDSAGNDEDGEEDANASAGMKILAPAICRYVSALWKKHEEAQSAETVGILVRNNKDGAALAEKLRATPYDKNDKTKNDKTIPVVWEGADGIRDSSVVRAILELLKLSEHPEDKFAWKMVSVLTPLNDVVFPKLKSADEVSCEMSKMLTQLGLSRTLKEITSRIKKSDAAPDEDGRSWRRIEALVRAAVTFEHRRDASRGILSFIDYLDVTATREVTSSPHVVRILTIHRSKGLSIDHVVVPIMETEKGERIDVPRRGSILHLKNEDWAVDDIKEDLARGIPKLHAAWLKAANDKVLEQLRLNYVALTRARKSTHVFVCDDGEGNGVKFRKILLSPFEKTFDPVAREYGVVAFEAGTMPSFQKPDNETARAANRWSHGGARELVMRRSPAGASASTSASSSKSTPVGEVFASASESATEKGLRIHEKYASIEWIDADKPASDEERAIANSPWKEAFVKTNDVTCLWREQSYELYIDGLWETGRFDRVVFKGNSSEHTATIYDFKTHAKRLDESDDQFNARVASSASAQMNAYRTALSALTGIPPSNITTKLLLTSTLDIVTL